MLNDISPVSARQKATRNDVFPQSSSSDKKSELIQGIDTEDVVEISGKKPMADNFAGKMPLPVNGGENEVALNTDAKNADKMRDTKEGENGEEGKGSQAVRERELSDDEQQQVRELEKREVEVRQHENAYLGAAGGLAQGMSFEYATGPDGKRYISGGEVRIDTSPVPGEPDATIAKARTVRRAANAPAEPSAQDRQVAAAAARMEAHARAEKLEEASKSREDNELYPYEATSSDSDTGESGRAEEAYGIRQDTVMSAYGQKETAIGGLLDKTV
jgi:hypothetical protein